MSISTKLKNWILLPTVLAVSGIGFLNALDYAAPDLFSDHPFLKDLQSKLSLFQEKTSPEKIYIQSDKIFYKPGETIWFSAYIRDAQTLKAAQSRVVYVELISPKGTVEKTITLLAVNGQAAGDFSLDASAKGGIYKIKAYTRWQQNTKEFYEKELTVQAVVLPNLTMRLDFQREAYGIGDEVMADLSLANLDNTVLANQDFEYVVSLNGEQVETLKGKTDAQGRAMLKYKLPKKLQSNDGLVNVMLKYKGQTESISRSIPIVLGDIDLQFFPEGGELVANQPSTLAFKAVNEFGKPADIQGLIQDAKGKMVASFKSYHQGMGSLEFTPQAGETYTAIIEQPANVKTKYAIPAANANAYSVRVLSQDKANVQAQIYTPKAEEVFLVAQNGGKMIYSKAIKTNAGLTKVEIPSTDLPIGISQLTLFDANQAPKSERLVFINPHKQLQVSVSTDQQKYLPREKVKMTVTVKDELGNPVKGNFSLAVADDKLLSFADDKQAHVLSQVLLQGDLQGKVEEPNFYFDNEKDASREKPEIARQKALDNLLLTQGWRRFAWKEVQTNTPNVAYSIPAEKGLVKGLVYSYDRQGKNSLKEGVRVLAFPSSLPNDSSKRVYTTTDKNGVFAFNNLMMEQAYTLSISDASHTSQYPQNVGDFTESLALYAYGKRTIKGIVTNKKGKVLENMQVYHPQKGTYIPTDKNGAFEYEILDINGYNYVYVYDFAGKFNAASLQIPDDMSKPLTVVMAEPSLASKLANSVNGANLSEVVVTGNSTSTFGGTRTLSSVDIQKQGTRSIGDLAAQKTGIVQKDKGEATNSTGSRAQSDDIFVDGVRSFGKNEKTSKKALAPKAAPAPPPAPPVFKVVEQEIDEVVVMGDRNVARNEPVEAVAVVPMELIANGNITRVDDIVEKVSGKAKNTNDKKEAEKAVEAPKVNKEEAQNANAGIAADDDLELALEGRKKRDEAPMRKPAPVVSRTRYYVAKEFYAPKYTTKEEVLVRNDFRSTIYWNPTLQTNEKGMAEVEFYQSDDISQYRVSIEGFGQEGGVGRTDFKYFTQQELEMVAKVPAEILTEDRLSIPVALTNNTEKAIRPELRVALPAHLAWVNQPVANIELAAKQSKTVFLECQANAAAGEGELVIVLKTEKTTDRMVTNVKSRQRGFPVRKVFASADKSQKFEFSVDQSINGSISVNMSVQPSNLEGVLKGMESMLRMPSGCFEQTSSSNYPNVMIMSYLRETNTTNAALESKVKGYMDEGYKRLTGYEAKSGGFHWFGYDPGHEALTAYGLMQFVDMKKIYSAVDQNMINRNAKWLLSRKNSNGGWQLNQNCYHSWTTNTVTDAYIVWALTEAGFASDLKTEIEKSYKDAVKSEDPYQIALMIQTLQKIQDKRTDVLLKELVKAQKADGSFMGLTASVTHSTGNALKIETTALAAMAMMQAGGYMVEANKAVDVLQKSKDYYGYGSTQGTVLALKALLKHANLSKRADESGEVAVIINGKEAHRVAYVAGQREITIPALSKHITEGKNTIEVKYEKTKTAIPYDITLAYNTRQPQSSADCKLNLSTSMATTSAKMGETVRIKADLSNKTNQSQSMAMAMIGIPAGLSLQPWQLKEMQDKKLFDYYEIFEGYVVLHFERINANELKSVAFDLKADIPGTYEAPASTAFLYYSHDQRHWVSPAKIAIQ